MRTKKHLSDGKYAATLGKQVIVISTREVTKALKAGFAITPLRDYLAQAYRDTTSPALKALIDTLFPECRTGHNAAQQSELPLTGE